MGCPRMTHAKMRNRKNGEQERIMRNLKTRSEEKMKSHPIVENGLASSTTNSSIHIYSTEHNPTNQIPIMKKILALIASLALTGAVYAG